MDSLKNEQHRGSTKRNYQSVWRTFNQFLIRLDVKPTTWEDRLALFVGHLVSTKKQSSTVHSYVSAIRAILKLNSIDLNPDQYLLSALTKACKFINDKVRTRNPIRKSLLLSILAQVMLHFDQQPYLCALYSALFSTAYYGLFRVGELTMSLHVVKACDVHIGMNKKKILFILRSSKTHGENVLPQKIKISSSDSKTQVNAKKFKLRYCPYKLLRDYLRIQPKLSNKKEQFFVFADSSPVQPHHMRATLKMILKNLGYDHTQFSAHSYRSGRACDLLKYGLSVKTIKEMGRWRSNAVFVYLKNL